MSMSCFLFLGIHIITSLCPCPDVCVCVCNNNNNNNKDTLSFQTHTFQALEHDITCIYIDIYIITINN